jgi:glycosyltransferase involved in cell wall biosynthesis
MSGRLTILIAARNAAATITRAVASCLSETGCPLVLADDGSTDDTVALARNASSGRLRVVRTPAPGGVALARQCALDAVETAYAAWLDADDEWIPGRAARLTGVLDGGCDVAADGIDLHDGPSGRWLRRLEVPGFLQGPGGFARLFERNFLPGDTQVAFRTPVFRDAGGYDPSIRGPESYDLLLRVVRQGGRLGTTAVPGYRMYAYPASLSRDLTRQRQALAAALRKHPYEDVRRLYRDAGHGARIAAWALVMMAQFRADPRAALRYLDEASPADGDPSDVLEPDGAWPFCEGWRRAFHRGTILLALGERTGEASEWLRRAETIQPTAEGANNLGVALARLGQRRQSDACIAAAAARLPGYVDAVLNGAMPSPSRVTTHPLRRRASRSEYS